MTGGAVRARVHEAISLWIDETKDDPLPEVRYALAEA
jgi:hypothetical protein